MSRFYDVKTQARVDSVPKKDGKGTRDPTISDARKPENLWRPSVTTISDVVSKPFLLTWLQQQAFESAWGSAQTPMPKDEAWQYYLQQSAIARDRGSSLHDKMSRMEECPETLQTIAWISNQGYVNMEHEVQFAADKYGGTIDFIGYVKEGADDYMAVVDILDFKFVLKDRQPHESELWQLSAYREALIDIGYAVRSVANIYISQENGHIFSTRHWTNDELASGYETFKSIINLWENINNYRIGHGQIYKK